MTGRIVILGAGPTGLGAAYRLGDIGHEEWDIYERASYVTAMRAANARGGTALAISADVCDHSTIEAAAERVERELGPIDVWINNAMVSEYAPVWQMTPEEFTHIVDVTLLGQVYGTMAALDQSLPDEPLVDLARKIPPKPALFIASNELGEPVVNRKYATAYGDRSALWRVDAGHTRGLAERPRAYERRVIAFFNDAL